MVKESDSPTFMEVSTPETEIEVEGSLRVVADAVEDHAPHSFW